MSSIKIRTQQLADETEIRLLITHPMENGRNRDSNGSLIPAHFIKELCILRNQIPVLSINMAGSMAKNPFFSFRLKSLLNGDIISVKWTDNQLQSDSAELQLATAY
jgi:sulfur-oxidizing protein SoxZ